MLARHLTGMQILCLFAAAHGLVEATEQQGCLVELHEFVAQYCPSCRDKRTLGRTASVVEDAVVHAVVMADVVAVIVDTDIVATVAAADAVAPGAALVVVQAFEAHFAAGVESRRHCLRDDFGFVAKATRSGPRWALYLAWLWTPQWIPQRRPLPMPH